MKLPAFQFYPADWRKDPGVQSLTYFDRGVWFEILCLMHESDDRGRLLLNGAPMPEDALARLLGLDKHILSKTLATLLRYGVIRKGETGIFYNKRMVEDERLRQIRTENGKKGGNPALLNHEDNHSDNHKVKQNPTPSSSSSSSVTTSSSNGNKKLADKPPRNSKKKSNDEFFAELKTDPTYSHVDIDFELGKAKKWCAANNRQLTQRFFVNWINRIDRPLTTMSRPDPGRPVEESKDWQCDSCFDTCAVRVWPDPSKPLEFTDEPCPDCSIITI